MDNKFRKMLETFYANANQSSFKDIYLQTLIKRLDEVHIEPVHVIGAEDSNIPTYASPTRPPPDRKLYHQYLYKSANFASVFLLGLLLETIKRNDLQLINNLHSRTIQTLNGEKVYIEANEYKRLTLLIERVFKFLYEIQQKQYKPKHLQPLVKQFYVSLFEHRSLLRVEKQKYSSQAQTILPFMLSRDCRAPCPIDVLDFQSHLYENNILDFQINLQKLETKQKWIIGQGKTEIQIFMHKNYYIVEKQSINQMCQEDNQLDQTWNDILEQAIAIQASHQLNTQKLVRMLNVSFQADEEDQCPQSATLPPHRRNFGHLS